MKQQPPFSIQIELTEGCNLFCKFCGIRGIREKPGNYKFMTLYDARKIAKKIGAEAWQSRIEFAMHGEPTLNPKFKPIISAFRKALPNNQLALLTNGVGLVVKNPVKTVESYFKAGLNIIAIDDYTTNPFSKEIKKKITGKFREYYYPQTKISPHSRLHGMNHVVIYIQDITTAKSGGHSVINSHCGCATAPPLAPLNKRCAKPFRELSIRYDGHIAICCNDWRGHYICGNALDQPIEVIWNNDAFHSARKMLYYKKRNFAPCQWCDAISYRTGLLPDKMGKQTVPPLTSKDRKIIAQYSDEVNSLAPKVLRKWELRKPPTIKSFLK